MKTLIAPLLLVAATGVLVPSTSLAAAPAVRPERAVPVPGHGTPCTATGPQLLAHGAAPLRTLRVDLDAVSGQQTSLVTAQRTDVRALTPDGQSRRSHEDVRVDTAISTGHAARGRLPYSSRLDVHYASTNPDRTVHRTVRESGYLDGLAGGRGSEGVDHDHLPLEPVGIGATWRIVSCDALSSVAAEEIRTYRLRSVANGVVVASFRDEIRLDPAHMTIGTAKTHFRLLTLSGSSTGTLRMPLANAFAVRRHVVTRFHLSFQPGVDTGASVVREAVVLTTSSGAAG